MGEIRTDQCLRQKRSFCGEQNEVLILPFAKLFLKRLRNNQVKNGQLFKPVVLKQRKTFYESLILAQDERWRRA